MTRARNGAAQQARVTYAVQLAIRTGDGAEHKWETQSEWSSGRSAKNAARKHRLGGERTRIIRMEEP